MGLTVGRPQAGRTVLALPRAGIVTQGTLLTWDLADRPV
jgi:hypothetical protein